MFSVPDKIWKKFFLCSAGQWNAFVLAALGGKSNVLSVVNYSPGSAGMQKRHWDFGVFVLLFVLFDRKHIVDVTLYIYLTLGFLVEVSFGCPNHTKEKEWIFVINFFLRVLLMLFFAIYFCTKWLFKTIHINIDSLLKLGSFHSLYSKNKLILKWSLCMAKQILYFHLWKNT